MLFLHIVEVGRRVVGVNANFNVYKGGFPDKVINALDFTRDLSSLLGLFLLRKGKSERKLELGRRGKKFMEI